MVAPAAIACMTSIWPGTLPFPILSMVMDVAFLLTVTPWPPQTLNSPPLPAPPPIGPDSFELVQVGQNPYGHLYFVQKDVSTANVKIELAEPTIPPPKWQLKMNNPANPQGLLKNDPAEVDDVMLVLGYQWEGS